MMRLPVSNMRRATLTGIRNPNVLSRTSLRLPASSIRNKNPVSGGRKKYMSTTKEGSSGGKSAAEAEEEARQQVLHEANEKMKSYHHARLAKLRGELPSKRKGGPEEAGTNYVQMGVVATFIVLFAASPFLGKKIAKDKEFREKYVPAWYDFTIKKPTSELSREEVHEQILQLQKEIRARAIKGDFTDEKLAKMRRYMDGLDPNKEYSPDNDEHAWSKLHPGVEDDEEVEEE